jgi:hypothetical protein
MPSTPGYLNLTMREKNLAAKVSFCLGDKNRVIRFQKRNLPDFAKKIGATFIIHCPKMVIFV